MPEEPGKEHQVMLIDHGEIAILHSAETLQIRILMPVRKRSIQKIPAHADRMFPVFLILNSSTSKEAVAQKELDMNIFQSIPVFLKAAMIPVVLLDDLKYLDHILDLIIVRMRNALLLLHIMHIRLIDKADLRQPAGQAVQKAGILIPVALRKLNIDITDKGCLI